MQTNTETKTRVVQTLNHDNEWNRMQAAKERLHPVALMIILGLLFSVRLHATCYWIYSDVQSTHYEETTGCDTGTGYGWSDECPNNCQSINMYVVITTCSGYSIDCHQATDYYASDGIPEGEVCDPVVGDPVCDYNTWSTQDVVIYCV